MVGGGGSGGGGVTLSMGEITRNSDIFFWNKKEFLYIILKY